MESLFLGTDNRLGLQLGRECFLFARDTLSPQQCNRRIPSASKRTVPQAIYIQQRISWQSKAEASRLHPRLPDAEVSERVLPDSLLRRIVRSGNRTLCCNRSFSFQQYLSFRYCPDWPDHWTTNLDWLADRRVLLWPR